MRYSLIFVSILSATALFGVDTITDSKPQEVVELDSVQTEAKEQSANTTKHKQSVKPAATHKPEPQRVTMAAVEDNSCETEKEETVLPKDESILISVTGQGVSPMNTTSPAQAYALAKRAAIADAYRMIAEKVKGVKVDGQDYIKNMMVKRSSVRTSVRAMVRNANVVETTFKEGLCEVEMEITLYHSDFAQ
jgi:hypothetical protein